MLFTTLAQVTDYSSQASEDAAAALASSLAASSTAAVGFAGFAIFMTIFWFIFGILGLILFIVALIDVLKREFPNPNDKIMWILLIILLYLIGPILYMIIGKKKGTIPEAPAAK